MITLFFTQMLASAGYILFRALQQLNCVNLRWMWIFPTSMCIALCEVYVIHMIATSELDKVWLVVSSGFGGTIGCLGAMWISNKFGGKKVNVTTNNR